ncbi:MAG: sugar phosphate nucleotidyltransferase, partial [Acidobacteriota bacterium]
LTDCDLRELISFHRQHRPVATMVLRSNADPARFTPIEVSPEGRILRIGYQAERESAGSHPQYMFAGIQMLSPEFFRFIPQGSYSELRDVYHPLLQQKVPLYGLIMKGFWWELGTPREYLEANLLLLKGDASTGGLWSRVAPLGETIPQLCGAPPPLLGEKVTIQKNAQFEGGVIIGDGSIIGKNCRIKNSLMWEDCSVGQGSILEESIVTDGVKLPPESIVRNKIVIAQGRGLDLPKGEPMGENLAFPI